MNKLISIETQIIKATIDALLDDGLSKEKANGDSQDGSIAAS